MTLRAACRGLVVRTEGGRITGVGGAGAGVSCRGHFCPEGRAPKDLHEDPDRLRTPARRSVPSGGPLQRAPAG